MVHKMKTRYKVLIFVGSVLVFYMSLVPLTVSCMSVMDDCKILSELTLFTRPVMSTSSWDTGNGVGAWSGTADRVEPGFTLLESFEHNMGFMIFVTVVFGIILGIVIIDKRKIPKQNRPQ